jgi:hypothetical protein
VLKVGMPVRIVLTAAQFAADRDFAAIRESPSRAGATLADLLERLCDPAAHYRIVYLYPDGRADLVRREGLGEVVLRNFPTRYLQAAPMLPQPAADHVVDAGDDEEPEPVHPVIDLLERKRKARESRS